MTDMPGGSFQAFGNLIYPEEEVELIDLTSDKSGSIPSLYQPQCSASGDGPSEPQAQPCRGRGVKPGTKRGPYKRISASVREEIVDVFRAEGDWREAAIASGVPLRTAYGYLAKPDDYTPAPRGGARTRKVDENMVNKMVTYVEENPAISLKEICRKLEIDTGVSLTITPIHRNLEGRVYTIKKATADPAKINSEENKQKTCLFAQRLTEASDRGRTIIYIGETNVNVFLRRRLETRSRFGTRFSVKAASLMGPDVHVLGAMSRNGMVHWERGRGRLRQEDCCQWLTRALQACPVPLHQVTIVGSDEEVFTDLESVVQEFSGLELLQASPCSAMVNPIEAVWTSMRSNMKNRVSISPGSDDMMDAGTADDVKMETGTDDVKMETGTDDVKMPLQEMSLRERMLRQLEAMVDAAMKQVTPGMCRQYCKDAERHYAECVALAGVVTGRKHQRPADEEVGVSYTLEGV